MIFRLSVVIGSGHLQGVSGLYCEPGFYFIAPVCQPCPQNCRACETASSCTVCKDGYYGDDCSNMCALNCNQDICHKTSGLCLHCKKGFYFDNNGLCVSCPDNCRDCDSKRHCYECSPGFKGKTCGEMCINCKNSTECKQQDGYCINACKDGYRGVLCDRTCDAKCRACNRFNSKVCIGCTVDRYGNNCTETCSANCYLRSCNETGFCTSGCEKGFWGKKCEHVCSEECKDNFCSRENGTCTYGCLYNHTGNDCSCPKNCYCDRQGVCKSCQKGFGEFCERNCSDECFNRVCSRENGECSKVKHNANNENNSVPTDDNKKTQFDGHSVGIVIGVVVVVFVVVLIVPVVVIKRRSQKTNKKKIPRRKLHSSSNKPFI